MTNYCHSGRSATMSRTFSLLSLILFTSGFTPDGGRALAEQIRVDTGLVFQNQDYQKAFETESFEEARRLFDDDETPRELVGSWRNNGEALEPKWRDGDTVPLLPFSQYSRFSRDHLDNTDEISDRRRDHRPRIPARIPHSDNYDWLDDRYDYIERDQGYHQRRNNNNKGGLYRQSSAFLDKERDGLTDTTSTRYREAFQARPTDYGQVLDDEEYLKPRPRKRRPPQNYEFALAANEASLREKNAENAEMSSRTNARNAVELKNLLKMQQQEGLSLSELLQRRNLTLNDLLGGKADVISALKAKDEEIDEYAEKVKKVAPNSFGKIFTTPKPIWSTTLKQELEVVQKMESPPIISTTKPTMQTGVDITTKSSVRPESTSGTTKGFTRRNGLKITTTAEPILVTTSEENMSTHKSLSSAVASNASSMSLNLGISQNETSEPNSKNREVKFDGFDEDEIMEFSDFPDYKKGKQSGSPMWIAMQDQSMPDLTSDVKENTPRDPVSTLSIERILSPTELTKSRDSSGDRFKEFKNDMTIVKVKKPASSKFESVLIRSNMDDTIMGQDYQDDGSVYTTQSNIEDKNGEQEIRLANEHSTDLPQHKTETSEDNSASAKHKDYEDIVADTESEARAEIFELFASTSTAKRLERLLKSRNMSIDELIALRQRGSSKIHLAEVSRLRTQKRTTGIRNNTETESREKSSTSKNANDGLMPPETGEPDESMLHVNKEIEEILKKSSIMDKANAHSVLNSHDPAQQTGNLSESAINEEFNASKENEAFNRLKEKVPPRMYEIVDLLTTFASLPFAKDIQREFGAANDGEIEKKQSGSNTDSSDRSVNNEAITTPRIQSPDLVESKYIEEIVKQEPNGIDERTVFREIDTLIEKETTRIDEKKSRMKPSIIASAAILGVTTIVFLTIFIVCRVRQKQKYRYRNTFSRAVFQGPMLAVRRLSSSSSLSNVMVNVMATSTTKRPERNGIPDNTLETEPKSDIDSDSLDAADSWETIPDYMK